MAKSETDSILGRTVGGMLSNALYDVLRGLFGGSVIALGVVVWQYIKHRPIDWWGMVALGAFVGLVLGALTKIDARRNRRTDPLEPPTQDNAGDRWKTKEHWRELYQAENIEKTKRQQIHDEELRKTEESLRQCGAERREALKKVSDLEAQLSVFTPLQIEAFQLANELKEFDKSLPAFPGKPISPDDTSERIGELLVEKLGQISAWCGQMGHAYAARFSARVTDLAHRLGAKGIDVSELQRYSESADIANIIKTLRDLTWNIEEP